ncbi:MAG TPA: RNA-directed DNA polymerase [Flavilitoribacter sp.]|nr:RNA-directed DNA polymerase [Flavilitoribacter sp.]HMQ86895.1 RNA-directed DNA polymerase [Flavilitoribacter sp.]
MKRANNLLEKIIDPENLRVAFWKAQKGKSWSGQVAAFRSDLDENLTELKSQILEARVRVGDYHYFKIFDPKERQICASAFSEQVLHHALMNICHAHFEKYQIFDSYASRPGKGTHAALKKAAGFTRSNRWFLKLDVRKFFDSIHHEALKNQLARMFKERKLLSIFDQIIDSYTASPSRGVPIGNLTSQYFANHYLAGLDHFIKKNLRCKAYVRYMDDMVLWHENKDWLKSARHEIETYVETQLRCALKPVLLNNTKRGLPFLGYLIHPFNIRLSQRSKRRYIQKMVTLEKHHQSEFWPEDICQRRVLPLIAFTAYADAAEFRKNVLLKISGQSP